jgi:uncharacterized membrane protein YdjX (TVP38/TMEM64 family)
MGCLLITLYLLCWRYVPFSALCSTTYLSAYAQQYHSFVQTHYVAASACFIVACIAHGACALPATSLCIMLAGFLFGFWVGCLYALCASVCGGLLAYLFSRSLIGRPLAVRYHTGTARWYTSLAHLSPLYLIILRVIPVVPFSLMNILSGAALIPVYTFLWTLVLGIVPSLYAYSFLGSRLAQASTGALLCDTHLYLVVAVIILLSCLPLLYKKMLLPQEPS